VVRYRKITFLVVVGLLALSVACSETARYRVLSFLLDGVPPPGSRSALDTGGPTGRPLVGTIELPRNPPLQRFVSHTPYRENRCGGCHDADGGQLIRPVQEGLCVSCHSKVVAARFVHGPVAVNDCTVCHHHHAAAFPNLLLADPVSTCLNCHEREDLSTGEHHAALDQKTCVDCHNPHGGDNRFFVKGSGP